MSTIVSKPRPRVEKWAKKFWENCRQGKFTVQKCKDCGKSIFVPKIACDNCLSQNLDWVEVSGKGKVYAYSCPEKIAAPPGFADYYPYIVALIDLEEGFRIGSNIVQCDCDKVYIGMPVEVVFEKLDDEFTLPLFKPAAKAK